MAKDKNQMFTQALDAIERYKLIFIEDVVAYIPCAKETFYKYFPLGSNEMDEIKSKLSTNTITMKVNMRKKWYESDNPTLQLCLMKLLSSEEELRKLSMEHRQNSGRVGLDITGIDFSVDDDEESESAND